MCLEEPARIVEVDPDGFSAIVSTDRGRLRVLLLALEPDAEPVESGAWLLVHSGIALERIGEDRALEMLGIRARAHVDQDYPK